MLEVLSGISITISFLYCICLSPHFCLSLKHFSLKHRSWKGSESRINLVAESKHVKEDKLLNKIGQNLSSHLQLFSILTKGRLSLCVKTLFFSFLPSFWPFVPEPGLEKILRVLSCLSQIYLFCWRVVISKLSDLNTRSINILYISSRICPSPKKKRNEQTHLSGHFYL